MTSNDRTNIEPISGGWLQIPELSRRGLLRLVLAVALAFAAAEAGARLVEQTQTTPPLRWYDEAAQLRVEMMEERNADVVFAGTSMAQQAFIPSAFDASENSTSFNVGLPGAVPTVSGPWLTDVVMDRLSPTTVIWGLSSLDLSSSYGDEPTAAWRNAPETRTDILGRIDTTLARQSAFIRMRSLLRRPDSLWGNGADLRAEGFEREHLLTGADGQRLGYDAERTTEGERINRSRLQQFSVDPDDVSALTESVRSLQDDGVRVVFVELPVAPAFVALHPRGSADYDLASAVIEDLAADLGVDHLGLEAAWDNDDFADYTHLTADSAANFTASVTERLREAAPGDLVPERNGALEEAAAARAAMVERSNSSCEPEVVVDDYGFEVELTSCPDSELTTIIGFPNDEVETAFDLAIDRSRASALVCSDADAWRASMTDTLVALDGLTASLSQVEPSDEWIGSAESAVFMDAIALEVLGQPTCSDLPHRAEAQTLSIFGRAVAALNELSISAAGNNNGGGPLWFRTDQAGHANALRDLVDSGEQIEMLTIGSSTVKRGFDTSELTEQTGLSAFNVGVAALSPEVAGPWMSDVFELGVRPSTIVVGFTAVEIMTPCNDGRRDETQRSLSIRAALARLGIDALTLPIPGDDPFLVAYEGQYESRGTTVSGDGLNADRVAEGRERFERSLRDEPCDERTSAFAELLDGIRETLPEARIIVVDMPLHPEMVLAHPNAPNGFDIASANAQETAAEFDAEYLDAQELLPAEEFGDILHANSVGRARLTERLLEQVGL